MTLELALARGGQTTIALSGLLIAAGVVSILTGRSGAHKKMMIAACVLAAVFVVIYVVRSSLFPHVPYAGEHRGLYLSVLFSHTVMSLVNLPLAVITVYLALKGRTDRHRKVAPYTAAVWIYVAATGWSIFLFNG